MIKATKKAQITSETPKQITESRIDDALEASFPASDPPFWTLGCDSACQKEKESKANLSELDKKGKSLVAKK